MGATLGVTAADGSIRRRTVANRLPWSGGQARMVLDRPDLRCGGSGIRTHGGQDPHTLSKRADSAALASLQGVVPRTGQAIVSYARDRRWRPGPVQLQPVNRVRAGRQQLSADPAVCRRSPDRHMGERVRRASTGPGPGVTADRLAERSALGSSARSATPPSQVTTRRSAAHGRLR